MVAPSHSSAIAAHHEVNQQRWRLLQQVSLLLDRPMTVLSFVWLVLVIVDLTQGLSESFQLWNDVIWVLFGVHFGIEFLIAPNKLSYLQKNWLTAIALVLPAFRILRVFRAFRVLRAARAVRSLGMLRLLTSLNRGMRATRKTLQQRGIGYVAALTVLVTLLGAAGMYFFENPAALRQAGYNAKTVSSLDSYGEAVWWTAMLMTTMGTDYWPQTIAGRLLCIVLAVYAFAVFGYITAAIASQFILGDARTSKAAEPASSSSELRRLADEVARLRSELATLSSGSVHRHGNAAARKR